ncbi:MAG: polar amino acid transport system substrate-binding protein [Alteromonadaceae bacterium]
MSFVNRYKHGVLAMTFAMVLISFVPPVQAKEPLNIAAIDWCPQICPKSSENPGYLVQMLQDLFKDSDYTLNIIYSSWSEAINSVKAGIADGLLSPSKDEAPDLIYHQIPLAVQTHCFWTLADSNWQFDNIATLKNDSIVIYRDHSYATLLAEYFSDNYKKYLFELSYDQSYLPRAHRLLKTGRASAFLFTTNSVLYFKRTHHDDSLKMGACIKKDQLWIGLSPHQHVTSNNSEGNNQDSSKYANKINKVKAFIDQHLAIYKHSNQYKMRLKKYNILTPEVVKIK